MNNFLRIGMVIAAATLLAACAETIELPSEVIGTSNHPGFWWGLWNGLTLPFSFIGSLFNDGIAVYAVNNSGGWYDFGFVMGVSATLSGGASAKR